MLSATALGLPANMEIVEVSSAGSGERVADAGGIGFSHEEKWSYATSKKVNGTGENPIKRIKTDLESQIHVSLICGF